MIKKICGFTRPEDVQRAVRWGANAVGFVFYHRSARCVSVQQVLDCTQHIDASILRVGVFVHRASEDTLNTADQVCHIADAAGLNVVQLHGQESPAFCQRVRRHFSVWKALSTQPYEKGKSVAGFKNFEGFEENVDAFLIDHQLPQADLWGGTGQTCSWTQAAQIIHSTSRPVILAGGLHSGNVQEALKQVQPAGIDASSCLEDAPGKKNAQALQNFLKALPHTIKGKHTP